MEEWIGDNPFYLMIRHQQISDGVWVHSIIDLDEGGWLTKHHDLMRLPGRWYLVDKVSNAIIVAMTVIDGEQPYYAARHIGIGSLTEDETGGKDPEIIAYGIGKKRLDGHVDRIWYFPGGPVVTGDDVNDIGLEVLKLKLANVIP